MEVVSPAAACGRTRSSQLYGLGGGFAISLFHVCVSDAGGDWEFSVAAWLTTCATRISYTTNLLHFLVNIFLFISWVFFIVAR